VVAGAIVLIAAIAATLFFFLREDGAPSPQGRDAPAVPAFSFEVRKTTAFPLARRPRKSARKKTIEDVRAVLDRLYIAGFLDPAQWTDERFTGALEQFAGSAARVARRDLDDLTLGGTGAQLEYVAPEEGLLNVSLLFDTRRRPVIAVAKARFQAVGELSAGGQVSIEHRGEYILRLVRGRWAIVGYDVRGRIAERDQSAVGGTPSPDGPGSPSPTEGASP
jgi:hypothetical protein